MQKQQPHSNQSCGVACLGDQKRAALASASIVHVVVVVAVEAGRGGGRPYVGISCTSVVVGSTLALRVGAVVSPRWTASLEGCCWPPGGEVERKGGGSYTGEADTPRERRGPFEESDRGVVPRDGRNSQRSPRRPTSAQA